MNAVAVPQASPFSLRGRVGGGGRRNGALAPQPPDPPASGDGVVAVQPSPHPAAAEINPALYRGMAWMSPAYPVGVFPHAGGLGQTLRPSATTIELAPHGNYGRAPMRKARGAARIEPPPTRPSNKPTSAPKRAGQTSFRLSCAHSSLDHQYRALGELRDASGPTPESFVCRRMTC